MREKGFTLIETLLVLVIVFVLIVASTSFFLKTKERITFHTYVQQFKLMTYEAYAIAIDQDQIVHVGCNYSNPYIYFERGSPIRELSWPSYIRLECDSNKAFDFYGKYGVREQKKLLFFDEKAEKRVKYSVNFTYGRLRETE